jgi:hypothetical protein
LRGERGDNGARDENGSRGEQDTLIAQDMRDGRDAQNPQGADGMQNPQGADGMQNPQKSLGEKDANAVIPRSQRFSIGDSVTVYPKKELGIVYARANEMGEVGVQIKGIKRLINHKRIKLKVAASELYPDDYDFSIVFDSVANRKARRLMGKRHVDGNMVVIEEDD